WATLATRGNAAYALAIVWALVGIVVANTIERAENLPVAVAAGSMAVVVAAALAWVEGAAGGGGPPPPEVRPRPRPRGRGDAPPPRRAETVGLLASWVIADRDIHN